MRSRRRARRSRKRCAEPEKTWPRRCRARSDAPRRFRIADGARRRGMNAVYRRLSFASFAAPILALTMGFGTSRLPADPPGAPLRPRFDLSPSVLLGIDVLEAEHFAVLRGKRIGLLTHPAGVNRFGVSTIEILRRA